jgi:hypothetical protein
VLGDGSMKTSLLEQNIQVVSAHNAATGTSLLNSPAGTRFQGPQHTTKGAFHLHRPQPRDKDGCKVRASACLCVRTHACVAKPKAGSTHAFSFQA